MTDLRDAAMTSKAWPFEEARKLVKRYAKAPPEKGYVLFETGYGCLLYTSPSPRD